MNITSRGRARVNNPPVFAFRPFTSSPTSSGAGEPEPKEEVAPAPLDASQRPP